MNEKSPYLQELIEVVPIYKSIGGLTDILISYTENDFSLTKHKRDYMCPINHASLEQHVKNPNILREINIKKLPEQDIRIVTFTDLEYEQMIICSSYSCQEIISYHQKMKEHLEEWFYLELVKGRQPVFL